MSNEIPREELERNQLLQNAQSGDCFIYGDRVDTIWWKEINHEQLKLSTIQLFSILNDADLDRLQPSRWTLMERNKDTWKGTVREQAVYHDLNNQKIYAATEEE